MNELKGNQPEEKKSLMNSLERLNRKAYSLEDLGNLSHRLLQKFTNPNPNPEPIQDGKMIDNEEVNKTTKPDLVDLFNLTVCVWLVADFKALNFQFST